MNAMRLYRFLVHLGFADETAEAIMYCATIMNRVVITLDVTPIKGIGNLEVEITHTNDGRHFQVTCR